MRILQFPMVDELPKKCYECYFFEEVFGYEDDCCSLLRKRMRRDEKYSKRPRSCPLMEADKNKFEK